MIEELRTLAARLLDHGRHLDGDPMHYPINEAEAHAGSITTIYAAAALEAAKRDFMEIIEDPANAQDIASIALAALEGK